MILMYVRRMTKWVQLIPVPLFLTAVSFFASGCNPMGTSSVDQNFFPGVYYSLSLSQVTASSAWVLTGGQDTISLSLNDADGNPYISNSPVVSFSLDGGTSVGSVSSVTNHGDGTYSAIYSGEIAGTPVTVHAFVNGQELTSARPTIRVLPGDYSLTYSRLTLSAGTIRSGSTATVTLTTYDGNNQPLIAGGLIVAFGTSGGGSTVSFSPVVDHGDGTYTSTVTGLLSGSATTVTATILGNAFAGTEPTLTVVPGAASKLVFSTQPGSGFSMGSVWSPQPIVKIEDTNGNLVSSGSDSTLSISLSPSAGALSGTTSIAAVGGIASFSGLSLSPSGTVTLTASATGSAGAISVTSSAFSVIPLAPGLILTSAAYSNSTTVMMNVTCNASQILFQESSTAPTSSSSGWHSCSASQSFTISTGDGTHTIYAWNMDASGNISATSASVSMILDTTPPTLSLTSLNSGAFVGGTTQTITWSASDTNLAANPITLEYTLNGGTSWTSIASAIANTGSQSWTLPSATNTTTAKVRVTAIDKAGNQTQVISSSALTIDSTAPSVASISINSGASTTNSNFVSVNLQLTDNFAAGSFCLKYNTTTAPTSSDSCWVSVSSSLAGNQTAGPAVNISGYYFQLGYGAATYNVYAWAMDQAGNISTLSNSGNGTAGQDKAAITYTPGAAPVVSYLVAIASDLPGTEPPSLTDTTIPAGSSVYIRWAVSGNLGATPITINYKLTSSSTWTQVASGLVNGQNGSCTVNDPGASTTGTGCYVWNNGSPSSSAYQIQIQVTDTNSMTSLASSAMVNSGQIQVIAGNADPGLGGSAKTAMYFSTGSSSCTYTNQFVVAPNGSTYIYDYRGIFRIQPSTGISTLLIPITGTNNVTSSGVPASSATLDNVYGITLDYNENIIVRSSTAILSFPSNATNPTVTRIIGGGATTADGTAPLSFQLSSTMDTVCNNALLTPLPNGNLYFNQNNLVSYYNFAGDRLIHNLPAPSGTGVYGYSSENLSSCAGFGGYGLSFNLASSTISELLGWVGGCSGINGIPLVRLDPTNLTSQATYPSGPLNAVWAQVNGFKTGMDGNLYLLKMAAGTIAKLNTSTNTFSTIIGSGSPGYCVDGTLASNCATTPQSFFITQTGALYFLDNGMIRTVLSDGTVYTLYGAFGAAGDGAAAQSARLSGTYSVQESSDGKIQLFQNAYNVIREVGTNGIINTIAGNWNSAPPTLGTAATATTVVGLGAWSDPNSIYTDPSTDNIYYMDGYGAYILNRTTSKWSRVLGGGSTAWYNGDGMAASSLNFTALGGGYNIMGFGSTLYVLSEGNATYPVVMNNLKSYSSASGYIQTQVYGANDVSGLSYCAVGGSATGCYMPNPFGAGQPFFDATASRIFVPHSGNAWIWVYQGGSFTSSISTASNVENGIYRLNSSSQDVIYYCNGTSIYEKNLSAGTEHVLANWPSGFSCSGSARNMVYDSANNRLIFIFTQNQLNGIAAYYLTD